MWLIHGRCPWCCVWGSGPDRPTLVQGPRSLPTSVLAAAGLVQRWRKRWARCETPWLATACISVQVLQARKPPDPTPSAAESLTGPGCWGSKLWVCAPTCPWSWPHTCRVQARATLTSALPQGLAASRTDGSSTTHARSATPLPKHQGPQKPHEDRMKMSAFHKPVRPRMCCVCTQSHRTH